jgi:hypothetical protein
MMSCVFLDGCVARPSIFALEDLPEKWQAYIETNKKLR